MPDRARGTSQQPASWRSVAVAGLAALLIAGCSMGKDATGLLDQPKALVADARSSAAAPSSPSRQACAEGSLSVDELVRQARTASSPGGQPVAQNAAAPCPTSRPNTAGVDTGLLLQPRGPQVIKAAASPAGKGELFVDFDPELTALADKEKAMIREAVSARLVDGATRVSIAAGRGGSGNMFDQAVIAQKRARAVRELLPSHMVESPEFDPELPEDTVRIAFMSTAAKPR